MISAAAAQARASSSPYPVPAELVELWQQVDWNGYLPLRSTGLSWKVERLLKRLLDIVLSAILLVVLAPLLLLIAIGVQASSPGPIFYRWRTIGMHARPFITYKFRTMIADADAMKAALAHLNEMTGPAFKMRNDPRITPFGALLRRYSLDELPQLWSVLIGDMSLVGPRPTTAEEFVRFKPEHRAKLAVPQGLTCIWQVSGRNEISEFDDWMELDRQYIVNWSLWLDLRLLFATIPAVATARGAR